MELVLVIYAMGWGGEGRGGGYKGDIYAELRIVLCCDCEQRQQTFVFILIKKSI
jgi:hypothetical protein